MNRKINYLSFVLFVFFSGWSVMSAEIAVLGKLTHTQNAQPGEIYKTRIVIKNLGDQENRNKSLPKRLFL